MKKINSISLSIFLVVGAVFLFSACSSETQANDEPISSLYAGHWVSSSLSQYFDDEFVNGTYAVGDMVITSEGSIATNAWCLTDLAESEGTLSVVIESESSTLYTNVTENVNPSYISYSITYTDDDGAVISHTGRCYGMLRSHLGYTQMQCLTKVTMKGGPYSLDEQIVTRSTQHRESIDAL
jgi:hypothetical protein